MKKSLSILMSLAMALCLAIASVAAPSVVDDAAGEDAGLFGDEAALAADDTLGEAPEKVIDAKELMSVAVRLHSELNDGGLTTEYNLDTYYNYALNNGIFVDGVHAFGAETDIPTRAQVVVALYNAVNGKIDITAVNEVLDMIDVAPDAAYYEEALAFMKAGIITGYDDYGSFKPANTVKRYEIALMVDRLLNSSERVTKEYTVYSSVEPFYLMDDFLHDLGARGYQTGASGWRIDYTGSQEIGTINNYANILRDYAVDDDMSTTRRIRTQVGGQLVFETVYKVTAGSTVHFGFYDVNGDEIAVAGWNNGYAYVGPTTTSVKLADKKEPTLSTDVDNFNYYMGSLVRTRVVLNLDTGKYEAWMGNSYLGEADLSGTNLASVKIYTGVTEVSTVEIRNTHLYKNYKVNDVFRLENQGEVPVGYEVNGTVTVSRLLSNANNTGEVNSMKMVTADGATTYAKRDFDKATGKVIAEAYVLLEDGSSATTVENNAYFTVRSSGVDALKVETKGNNWYVGSTLLDLTTPDDEFTSNVWQWIRIEADTATQTALIKINGKVAAENVPFLVKIDGFDSLEVGVVGTTANDVIYFDDIEVYETFVDVYNTDDDADNDYVPEPVPLEIDEYILNMSVCNLWRNGSHYGWDWIRPYAELEPAIGYYDEGNPESMDWEIKYLTEHGIQNYMTCWYPTSGGAPLKKPRMVDALHDGYFNAKYSDMITFSLMFENSGYISDAQKEDFVNNVFPLWMDWYFSDPRYFRITEYDEDSGTDKEYIFLTIYQYIYFLDMCSDLDLLEYDEDGNLYFKSEYKPSGTTPNSTVLAECADAVAMIEWMEEQIVEAGYADGLIVVFGGSAQSEAAYKTMANMGGDGIILYAWGDKACDVEMQKSLVTTHTTKAQEQGIDLLTLATPGFNDIGWTSTRPGYMTTDDFETILNDFHKPNMATYYGSSADSWKSKLITFDTWNEYGEGHYLFPTAGEYKNQGYGGFGYLDAIAEVFGGVERDSTDGDANNTYPTAVQKARIGSIYPADNDHYIRRDLIAEVETPESVKVLGGYSSFTDTSMITSKSNWGSYKGTECTNTGTFHSWVCNNGTSNYCTFDTYYYPEYNATKGCLYGTITGNSILHIGGTAITGGIDMDEVSYIRMKLGTSTGGGSGKIYFKNTTDTSDYDGFSEDRNFTFNTYIDGNENCEYLINVQEHSLWTGTLAGIRLDIYDDAGEEVYLYSFELITEDETTRKPTIYVDNQKYTAKDYGEIRSDPTSEKGEVYIAPTEEGGLYKLLHIVYSWNRSTVTDAITGTQSPAYVLKLDTPDGTTLEFNYNNKQIKKNGTLVGTDSNLEIYDGAPVIPLLYVLDNAGYYYSYNFTDRIINITVANTFEMDDQITNGDAEGTDTAEWYSGSNAYTVTVETDSTDSSNKVWQVNTPETNTWAYIRSNFVWEAGKTYTIDFDARRTGLLGDGTVHPADSSTLVFNARYADTAGTNGVEHNPTETRATITDSWQHFTIQYTVATTLDTTADTSTHQLTFYVDPYNSIGVPYQMDNIVVREQPIAFDLYNGDAEIAETADDIADTSSGFFAGHSNNTLSIQEESDGNHYWMLTNTVENNYAYIRQKTTFERGVTYYYRVRAKVGQNAKSEDVSSARITLNARYYDAAKLGGTGEWYAHTQDLKDKSGSTLYFSTGGDWQQSYGSFTISQGYDHDLVGTGGSVEEITFYAAPYNGWGISIMFDDFEVTTDPAVYASWIA